MSHVETVLELECDFGDLDGHCGAVELVIQPRQRDLGGFSVRRVLPTARQRSVGPWVFFDHMGPATFAPGPGINVRPHPHINLATVTYLFEGEIFHRDSLGSEQAIRPGDLNLMVAGRGIVHSERERAEAMKVERRLHGLQLWLALPEDDEETAPAFYHYPSSELPEVELGGVRTRVMMGSAYGATSPVKTFASTLYVEAHLPAGQSLVLPDVPDVPGGHERAVYVAAGAIAARDVELPTHAMGVFSSEAGVSIRANEASRIAIIGGEPLGPRHMEWNFVSSRKERIEEAKDDWREQRFPKVPGDEEEYIPYP